MWRAAYIYEYVDTLLSSGMFLNPDTIYNATLHELNLLITGIRRRNKEQEQIRNIRFGTIAAAIYNVQRTRQEDRVFQWNDFFADLFNETGPTPRNEMTDEEIYTVLDMMFGGYRNEN